MNRNLAKKFMNTVSEINKNLNEISVLIENLDDDERKIYRAAVANLMSDVYINFMLPIIKEYKDLDPDQKAGAE